jgi:hypothetical protein
MNAQPTRDEIIERLANGPLHPFADWRKSDVPHVAIGLYTVWKDDQFLYVGRSGGADAAKLTERRAAAKKSALYNRLKSHASGRKSGDQFCTYVADKLLAAAGHPTTDDFVKKYVCEHLSYRFYAFGDLTKKEQDAARKIEDFIREGKTQLGKPLLNPK